jgi:hypothetical protein
LEADFKFPSRNTKLIIFAYPKESEREEVYEIDGQFGLSKGFQIEFRFLANVER